MRKKLINTLRALMLVAAVALLPTEAGAQKFALVDMDYILKNVPAYERANEQLNQVSKKWQAEVEALATDTRRCIKTTRTRSSSCLRSRKSPAGGNSGKGKAGCRTEKEIFRVGR